MHAVVMDSLEEYLSGALEPAAQREIEAHLSTCESCREEIGSMQEVSHLFGSLRTDEVLDPSARLLRRRDAAGRRTEAGADVRRPVRAGLCLRPPAGVCVAADAGGSGRLPRDARGAVSGGAFARSIMAQQESPAFDSAAAQDNMLVTLTAYEQH